MFDYVIRIISPWNLLRLLQCMLPTALHS